MRLYNVVSQQSCKSFNPENRGSDVLYIILMAMIVMTAKQIRQMRKQCPRDPEKIRCIKALQDADIEPYMDEDSPEIPDLPPKRDGLFTRFFNWLLGRPKYNRVVRC